MQESIFQMYLEELEGIAPCTTEEIAVLLKSGADGSRDAKKRLIEGHLKQTLLWAKEYEDKGLFMADLLQEANMALTCFVEDYQGGEFLLPLENMVREKLETAIENQRLENQAEEEITARVNVLQTVSQRMVEELGREATVEELAEKMKMTTDDIRDIMKLALDALSVEGE